MEFATRPLVLPASLLALAAPPAAARQTLNTLETVYPDALPNAIAASHDATLLIAGEGATLVFVDTTIQPGAEGVIKRRRIGKTGATPSRLLLDPASTVTLPSWPDYDDYVPGPNDVLWSANGESGFWAEDPDPNTSLQNGAVRLDDSGNLDPMV